MKKYRVKIIFYLCLFYYQHILPRFMLGIENVSPSLVSKIVPGREKKVIAGLITNQTGVDQYNVRSVDVLLKNKLCDIKYIFVPEHGLTGVVAERDVPDSIDSKTNIPIISLYGNGTGKMISPELIK